VTWKQNGITHDTTRHDSKNNRLRLRLSKGPHHNQHPKAWEYILVVVEYETRPGVTVDNLQQVRAVSDKAKQRWELHLVCTDEMEIETPTAPGNETAGVDLGSVSVTLPPSHTARKNPTCTPETVSNKMDTTSRRKSPTATIRAANEPLGSTGSSQSAETILSTP
jgi:Probable transposase.